MEESGNVLEQVTPNQESIRDHAFWRLEIEAGVGEVNDEITIWKGFKMAFSDPKIWAL
ncbi:hypothetical protein F66182_14869, partial [Fusarium sp. NRRL 66182]